MTVCGFTMTSAPRQSVHVRASHTQRRRSSRARRTRGRHERSNTRSWCRSASSSMCKAARARSESRTVWTSEKRTDVMARSVSRSHDNINTDNKYGVFGRDNQMRNLSTSVAQSKLGAVAVVERFASLPIRLLAMAYWMSRAASAVTRAGHGELGRVWSDRLEAASVSFTGSVSGGPAQQSTAFPLLLPTAGPPSARVLSVNGVPFTANPSTFPDLTINTSGPVAVVIETRNIPTTATVNLTILNQNGVADTVIQAPPIGNCDQSNICTTTVPVVFPFGASRGLTRVTWCSDPVRVARRTSAASQVSSTRARPEFRAERVLFGGSIGDGRGGGESADVGRWVVCESYAFSTLAEFSRFCKLRVGSGPRGRWFESTRPDHFFP